jgi:hypothetical protein
MFSKVFERHAYDVCEWKLMMSVNVSARIFGSQLGSSRAEAISAIEGQVLTNEQRKRFAEWEAAALTPDQQRVEILRLYKPSVNVK